MILVSKNDRERSTAKNYHPVSFLSVVSKVSQKLGFWSFCFTVDLLTVCLALFHLFSEVGVHLNWLNWFHFLILEGGLLVILIDFMVFLSPFLDFTKYNVNSFFPRTARLWNSLPIKCFPLSYDLRGFKFRILLTVCSFNSDIF